MTSLPQARRFDWSNLGLRVASAVVPGHDDPAVPLLPGRLVLRLPILAVMLAMTIGFTAGSIAISIAVYHVDAGAAWPLGVLMATPLIFAVRWPLAAWRIAAVSECVAALRTPLTETSMARISARTASRPAAGRTISVRVSVL